MVKKRIDVLLVERGICSSREKAQAEIMAGNVLIGSQRVDKAGEKYDSEVEISLKGQPLKYVSRGGLKLEKALLSFCIDISDKLCIDIGASTGGFTDCMLKNGASKVFAIDVGYGQLAWELRQDSRVVCMEKTNIRYVELEQLGVLVDFASIDVSFISLTKVLPVAKKLLHRDGELVCLIKPQFEAGREKVGKKGVVRDKNVHIEVVNNIVSWCQLNGFTVKGLDYSPIKGPEGNIEYLIWLENKESPVKDWAGCINNAVNLSWVL